jgi:hypothetical protein
MSVHNAPTVNQIQVIVPGAGETLRSMSRRPRCTIRLTTSWCNECQRITRNVNGLCAVHNKDRARELKERGTQ